MTPAELQAHAKALVADWPDPTPEQLERLAYLLRPAMQPVVVDGGCVRGCQHAGGPGHFGACVRR